MSDVLLVLGDSMLDVDLTGQVARLSPEAPVPVLDQPEERRRPGGAALAALLAAREHPHVVLVTPLAQDPDAAALRALIEPRLELIALPWAGTTPVKTRLRTGSHALARIDRGGARGELGEIPPAVRSLVRSASAVLVADYGRGAAADPRLRALLPGRPPLVWDPHPLGASPVPGARLVTPNASEAAAAVPEVAGSGIAAVRRKAEALVARWTARAVSVTLGAEGALLTFGTGTPLLLPASRVLAADTCGAGDCFAATAAAALAEGAVLSEAVTHAVAMASAFVAAGGAAGISEAATHGPADDVLRQVRTRGGRVVATGGCFDLLHAGHIATLQAARRLGDSLVVCLNSDASVRRLKGPSRPLQSATDRARVLTALRCVDAVVVFDENTPDEVLRTIRPDIWVKGGDYTGAELPEAAVLAEWGGEAVTVPYVAGRSTTDLVTLARQ
jgi:D-beta-D-heptose 7-phosphate kinase / D-beta-D-heptose 1-phosphate adenosyltransferase